MKDFKEMRKYIHYDTKNFWLSMIFFAMNSIVNTISPVVVAEVVTYLSNSDIAGVVRNIIYTTILVTLALASMYLLNHYNVIYLENVALKIKEELSIKIMNQDYDAFMKKDNSDYLSMLVNDTRMIVERYCDNIFNYISSIISLVGAIIAIMYYNIPIAIISIIFAVYSVWFARLFDEKTSQKGMLLSEAEELQTKTVKEVIDGYIIFKVYDSIALALSKLSRSYKERERKNAESVDYNLRVAFYLSINASFGKHILWILAVVLVILGYSEIGLVIVIPTYARDVMYGVRLIMDYRNVMVSTSSVREKIDDFLTMNEDKHELPVVKENIVLQNISYSYNENNKVIDAYSHEFSLQGKYALVGESGCGKSTLMKLMLGFIKPNSGQILLDGYDLNEHDIQGWFKQLSYINQETYVFSDTIKNNIILDKEYDETLFKQVLHDSELFEWIDTLSEGVETILSENGKNVSGGQKQRIGIARALYHNKKILFIDEASSALNEEMAYNIEKRLLNDEAKTIFMITHHLNTELKEYFDEIIHLEKI